VALVWRVGAYLRTFGSFNSSHYLCGKAHTVILFGKPHKFTLCGKPHNRMCKEIASFKGRRHGKSRSYTQTTRQSTSRKTAITSDIVLREGPQARLVFRPEIVDNTGKPEAAIRGRFLYQKKKLVMSILLGVETRSKNLDEASSQNDSLVRQVLASAQRLEGWRCSRCVRAGTGVRDEPPPVQRNRRRTSRVRSLSCQVRPLQFRPRRIEWPICGRSEELDSY